MKLALRIVVLMVFPLTLCGEYARAEERRLELRDEETWEKTISLELEEAPIQDVLNLLFQVAAQPVVLNECIEGTVNLKSEIVTVREALASIVRIGDLKVRPRKTGYHVSCLGDAEATQPSPDSLMRLRFVLRGENGGIATRASMMISPNAWAEVKSCCLTNSGLDDTGAFYESKPQPNLRLEAFIRTTAVADRLTGVFEYRVPGAHGNQVLYSVNLTFDADLPLSSTSVDLGAFELGGSAYVLSVSRESD